MASAPAARRRGPDRRAQPHFGTVLERIASLPVPTLGVVRGAAMGGGVGLASRHGPRDRHGRCGVRHARSDARRDAGADRAVRRAARRLDARALADAHGRATRRARPREQQGSRMPSSRRPRLAGRGDGVARCWQRAEPAALRATKRTDAAQPGECRSPPHSMRRRSISPRCCAPAPPSEGIAASRERRRARLAHRVPALPEFT